MRSIKGMRLGWFLFALVLLGVAAFLTGALVAQASALQYVVPADVVSEPGSRLADGGGFPTTTPTVTATLVPSPLPTETAPAFIYPVETPTLPVLQDQQDFVPQVDQRGAVPETTRTSPSLGLLFLPFGVAFILVVVILTSWIRRRR